MRSSAVGRIVVMCLVCVAIGSWMPPAAASTSSVHVSADVLAAHDWVWPLASFGLVEPYVQPAHRYGSGHRGVDLDPFGMTEVRAPADGIVAFTGAVAGRGILTIDHGGGLVTTLEPVTTTRQPGEPVTRGEVVATIAVGGHAPVGSVHFGVRLSGEYINPMLLLGGVPRAVLLPCC